MDLKYKRILLKLSGESLAGEKGTGIDDETCRVICASIKKCVDLGAQIGIVVGGGNFWRGRSSGDMNRVKADYIGMLATVMNATAVAEYLETAGVNSRVLTALSMPTIAEPYSWNRAVTLLEKGYVVVFGGGTGNPFCSTDTAAALRAAEIGADVIFKATMVDGVYDSDPKKNPNAVRFDEITLAEVLSRNLKVMDAQAAAMCRESRIPMLVFDISDTENLVRAVAGEKLGTIVKEA